MHKVGGRVLGENRGSFRSLASRGACRIRMPKISHIARRQMWRGPLCQRE